MAKKDQKSQTKAKMKQKAASLDRPTDSTAQLTKNRKVQPVTVDKLPAVPRGFSASAPEIRNSELRKFPEEFRSEGKTALRELIKAGKKGVHRDLGELAPDPAAAVPLLERVEVLEATTVRLADLFECHLELQQIVLSDVIKLLEEFYREYQHRVDRMPELAERYPGLEAFFRLRGEAISKGRIKAKKVEKKVEKATREKVSAEGDAAAGETGE